MIILLIVLLGFFLRMVFINLRLPTYDEAISLSLAKSPILDMIKGTIADVHPPLYFLTLHFWLKLEDSLFSARFLSTLLGTGTIIAAYMVGKKLFNNKTGQIMALIIAVSPVLVFESTNIRMYSLAVSESLMIFYFFLKFLRKQNLYDLTFFGLAMILGLYTHYYFLLILLILNLYFIVNQKGQKNMRSWLFAQITILLAFSPLLWSSLSSQHPQVLPVAQSLLKIPGVFVIFAVSWDAIQILGLFPPNFSNPLNLNIILLSICLFIFFLFGLKHLAKETWLFISYIFLPVILVSVVSLLSKPLFGIRSFIIFVPAYFLTAALGISKLKKAHFYPLLAAYFLLSGAFLFSQYQGFKSDHPAFASFDYLRQNLKQGDILLHSDPYTLVLSRHFFGDNNQYAVGRSWLSPAMEKAIGYNPMTNEPLSRERLWYFFLKSQSYNYNFAWQKQIMLEEKYQTLEKNEYPDLTLTLFSKI